MVTPVKYLPIYIDSRTFNRIIRFITKNVGANSDLIVGMEYEKKLKEPNEFIRLKHETYYIDLTIDKVKKEGETLNIIFDKVLDFNRTRFIPKPKTK